MWELLPHGAADLFSLPRPDVSIIIFFKISRYFSRFWSTKTYQKRSEMVSELVFEPQNHSERPKNISMVLEKIVEKTIFKTFAH